MSKLNSKANGLYSLFYSLITTTLLITSFFKYSLSQDLFKQASELFNIKEESYTDKGLAFTSKLNPTFRNLEFHWQCRVHNKDYNINGFGEALSRKGATDRAKEDCWMKIDTYLENRKKEEQSQKKLKILLLSANPDGLGPVEESTMIHQVKDNVQNALGARKDGVVIHDFPSCQSREIVNQITNHEPDVVHFFGHSSNTELAFVNERREPALVTIDGLMALFELKASKKIEVVLLTGCLNKDIAKTLSSVVPYVIGTGTEIDNSQAERFASQFYYAIAAGDDVEEAFKQARATSILDFPGTTRGSFLLFKDQKILFYTPEIVLKEGL